MQNYLVITIDTEEDDWGNYNCQDASVENINNIKLLQNIFNKYNATPTYLINYPVATNEVSVKILKKYHIDNLCDIGVHCHPWNTPPFTEEFNAKNSFMCNLPDELVYIKMSNLLRAIKNNFNTLPISFRAGRWGFGPNIAKIIRDLGLKIDTSITPFCNWNKYLGPVFDLTDNVAYGFNENRILCRKAANCSSCLKEKECILQLPPTVGFLQSNFKLCHNVREIFKEKPYSWTKLLGILDRARILNYRWLSPEMASCEDMINLSRVMMGKGYRFLNMSFHSTSLLPGKSPFVKTDQDLVLFLDKIDRYLKFALSENIKCIKLSAVHEVI